MKHLIAPSLLSADFMNLRQEVEMINRSEADHGIEVVCEESFEWGEFVAYHPGTVLFSYYMCKNKKLFLEFIHPLYGVMRFINEGGIQDG